MDYITFNNGVKIPMVGFGTWNVRGQAGQEAIVTALKTGYRLIDTAQMYQNEKIVGEAIKQSGIKREDLFITTKLYRNCESYEKAKAGIHKSLQDLQLNYIDLLLIHEPYETSLDMYEALKEAYQEGLVRAIGISNFNAAKYEDFIRSCGIIPAINQVESHVYFPRLELKKTLEKHGTKMQSWGPFTEGRRPIFKDPTLCEIAKKHHKTSAQIALKFLVQNGIAVIPKSVHEDRMKENFEIFDFSLDDSDLKRIAALDEHRSLFGWY